MESNSSMIRTTEGNQGIGRPIILMYTLLSNIEILNHRADTYRLSSLGIDDMGISAITFPPPTLADFPN